jgi:hypothetical protein
MLVKFLIGARSTEAIHPDEDAVGADERIPTLSNAGFHGDFHLGTADDRGAVLFGLLFEELEAGHGDDARCVTHAV